MRRHPLPTAYVKELNEHPYVEQATEWTINFTAEFKEKAYKEYIGGKSMREVFRDAGFDDRKLGTHRIENFRNRLMKRSVEEGGFGDRRKDKSLETPPNTEARMMKRIRELEQRNAYLEQENEFLKKIQSLEKGCDGKAAKRK